MPEKLSQGPKVGYDARVGAGLSRGPNLRKKTPAAPWSGTWPAPGATLDLDFANNRGFVRGVGQGGAMDAVTFTRASNATFVKPDGTLSTHANQGALGKNLLTFPQDFDNALWLKNNVAVSVNVEIAPDGLFNADGLVPNTTNNLHFIDQIATTIVGTYTLTTYAKANGYNFVAIGEKAGTAWAYFNLSNGTVGNTNGSPTTSISDAGNGWYRCSITFASTGGAFKGGFVLCDNVNGNLSAWTGNGTSGIYIWGAQLELGSTATEYFPTNINQPRFDWASTAQLPLTAGPYVATTTAGNSFNLLTYSEQFQQTGSWATAGRLTISANTVDTTDPLGGNTADKVTETTDNGTHRVLQNFTYINNLTYTLSCYLKKGTRQWVWLSAAFGSVTSQTRLYQWFDLDNISLGATQETQALGPTDTIDFVSASITDVGNSWRRCSITYNVKNIPGSPDSASCDVIIGLTNANGTFSYTGETDQYGYIWGAQLHASSATTPLTANPTSNGLLIEESRTNRILWNRDATQANWVSTNITAAKDQTGIDGVANAASSLTATSADGTCIQTITLASGSRTGSVYLKRLTGTGTVQVSLDGSTYSTVDLSDTEWRRIVLSGTVTNPTVGIKIATSGDAVAMDYAQVEDGSPATTPILTTTATVTRATEQNPNSQHVPGLYDFITRDREGSVIALNQTVTTSRVIAARSGVRYVTRFIGFAANYLKEGARTLMNVREP